MKHYKINMTRHEKIQFSAHFELLKNVLDAYSTAHISGGSLHVVLDDGNWNCPSLEFCLKYAKENNDAVGMALCDMLLEMPEQFITDCQELDWLLTCEKWSRKAKH